VESYGFDGFFAIGSTRNDSSWDLYLQYAQGRTLHGLDLAKWRLGWTWDWILDRFRFGLGPSLGYLRYERVTESSVIEAAFVGLDAHVSFDFAKTSDLGAFFVRGGIQIDAPTWGPVLQVGFRGDVVNRAR
jgi:hypothetical protein